MDLLLPILVGSLILCFFSVFKLHAYAKRAHQLREKESALRLSLDDYRDRCTDYQQKLRGVDSRAPDYVNSFQGQTSHMLLKLRSLVAEQMQITETIEALIGQHSPDALSKAELLLTRNLVPSAKRIAPTDEKGFSRKWLEESADDSVYNWESEAKELLRRIAHDILNASDQAKSIGLRGGRDRQETFLQLKAMGIVEESEPRN